MNKVLGIGLSRTATTTLNHALEILGYRSVHWPWDLSVIDRVDAATDQTVGVAFKELDAKYPGSLFILTVRDIESWISSMDRISTEFRHPINSDPTLRAFVYGINLKLYGAEDFDRQKWEAGYWSHLEAVKEHFKDRPEQLLIMDICAGDGWEKLCPFLGKPVPATPFPWDNRS